MDVGLCQYDDYLLVVGSKSSGVVTGSSIDYGNNDGHDDMLLDIAWISNK